MMHALVLSPSCGLGGGIERYVETLEWAFAAQGVDYRRLDLPGSGPTAHSSLLRQCRAHLRMADSSTRLVVAHRGLLPIAMLAASERPRREVTVVVHGTDVWGPRLRPRRQLERYLMSGSRVRVVAVSSFTAGALVGSCRAAVLPPGLSQAWFATLVRAANSAEPRGQGIHLVTAFRLADWLDKGLPQLLEAVAQLGRKDVRLTVCGSGTPSAELQRLADSYGFCTLASGLSDEQLASELASADLCVLATRTRPGRTAYGEGFGLILLEAQVAGTPVVAPAHGGCADAYLDGITGVAPADESAEMLCVALQGLLESPAKLALMSRQAAEWARQHAAPRRYAALAVSRLL
jgi:phosphatidyl-myo-inositol dimannoside synthase